MTNQTPPVASLTERLPGTPSLSPALANVQRSREALLVDGRVLRTSALAVLVALVAGVVAQLLTRAIGLVTNLSFYGRWSEAFVSPADNHLGLWVVGVPVIGGLVVGVLARFGSKAIRGHGIPEAMEQILTNRSRIPVRLTFLKPLSAAVAIGTGGPFGAEGPIIATGGAVGSMLGQLLDTSAFERKTLLAAGAAAGMAATFGSPVSAVLLAIELLLFEYRPRSLIPVALAASVATAVRLAFVGSAPLFPLSDLVQPGGAALSFYVVLGALVGLVSVGVTRAVYAVEDAFERLPLHWMWWPALGGVAVGAVGYLAPHTLGVGYDNIENILSGKLAWSALAVLGGLKFVSWVIALGSGTSGGTLAPLFTIGGGLGGVLGSVAITLAPGLGVDVRIAALVGMAALFAGASRALLASVVFAFEITRQPIGLLPLLGGCTAAFLVSCSLMRNTIMTEKIARRGVRTPGEYVADVLGLLSAGDHGSRPVVSLQGIDTLGEVRQWLRSGSPAARHQGYPIVDAQGHLLGVLTRRDLLSDASDGAKLTDLVRRFPVTVFEETSLRDAASQMVREGVGRLPIVARADPLKVTGILTRGDLLAAQAAQITEGGIEAGAWSKRRAPASHLVRSNQSLAARD